MSDKDVSQLNFWHVTLPTDTWQRIACRCKSAHIWLHQSPFDMVTKDDILVISDQNNTFAKCICKVLSARWLPGFKTAFKSTDVGALGYIRGEAIRASYHDFADDYSLNQVRTYGVVIVTWKLLSCEYIKYTDETDATKVKPRAEEEFDPEYKYLVGDSEDGDTSKSGGGKFSIPPHPLTTVGEELDAEVQLSDSAAVEVVNDSEDVSDEVVSETENSEGTEVVDEVSVSEVTDGVAAVSEVEEPKALTEEVEESESLVGDDGVEAEVPVSNFGGRIADLPLSDDSDEGSVSGSGTALQGATA